MTAKRSAPGISTAGRLSPGLGYASPTSLAMDEARPILAEDVPDVRADEAAIEYIVSSPDPEHPLCRVTKGVAMTARDEHPCEGLDG